jgi:hypothetical protein
MWKTRLTIAGLLVLILLLVGVLAIVLARPTFLFGRQPFVLSTATFLQSIQGVNQLVTVRYGMEKVIVLEDPPKTLVGQFVTGQSRVIMVAHGVVKAGVDLNKLTEKDLKLKGTNLVISLPRGEITDVYLDEKLTQILEHSTGFLRRYDATLPQEARKQALDEIRRAARYNGVVEEADTRARAQLKQLFTPLGVAVEFAP